MLLCDTALDFGLLVALPQLIVLPTTCACLTKLWELHIEQVQLCLPMMVVRRINHFNGDTLMCLKEAGQHELIGCCIESGHSAGEHCAE